MSMTNQLKLEALRARHARAFNATVCALGLACFAILGALAHFETSSPQITDVHVPENWLAGFGPQYFSYGEPYNAGTGHRKAVQWILLVSIAAIQLSGLGLLVWALGKKQKQFITPAAIIFLAGDVLSPLPKIVVPGSVAGAGAAKTVSIGTAEKLLAVKPIQGPIRIDQLNGGSLFRLAPELAGPTRAYVRAQIAFVRGDRAAAVKISENIDPENLGSRVEAPYRLQFLQNRYRGVTTVCFTRLGCINEEQRQWRFAAFAWFATIPALCAIAAWTLCFFLTRQLTRVEQLAAHAGEIQTSRYARSAAATAG
ncbi:MAG: hypothetical protein HOP13_02725 [Alphaproteobacteria bacterium]|nr:hypothetical protein [Alphaproteobacteria bacterium]